MDSFSLFLDKLFYLKPKKRNQTMKNQKNGNEKGAHDVLVFDRPDLLILTKNLIGAERNLELIGFFSPTSTRKGRPKTTKTLEKEDNYNGHRRKRVVSIIPSVDYGRPITTDLDIYRAFFKILKDIYFRNGKIENPVIFKDEDLIKAMGKSRHGRLSSDIDDWLLRMKLTGILSEEWIFDKKNKRYLKRVVSVFDKVIAYGESLENGKKSDFNFVWLADWFLGNLNEGYVFLIDHEIHKNLRHDIAKCLYGMLWWGFYSIKKTGGEFYWKDYSELCKFLDITEYKFKSRIVEKLSPANEELLRNRVISNWTVEKKSSGNNFNIKWWPGEAFESYYLCYKNILKNGKGQLGLNGVLAAKGIAPTAKELPLAEQLVKYFHQQLKGVEDYQPKEKELERAREIIEKHQKEKAWFITKFAIARIQETGFVDKVQYFGAIVNYTDEAIKEFDQTRKRQQAQAERRKQEFEKKKAEYKIWLELTPEQRVQGRLDFWIQKVKNFEHREPSEEEIKAKRQELIETDSTPEEKQEHIFGRVIFRGNTLELLKK